jgi:hypothetical protein
LNRFSEPIQEKFVNGQTENSGIAAIGLQARQRACALRALGRRRRARWGALSLRR